LTASIFQFILIAGLAKLSLDFSKISVLNWKSQIKLGIPLGLSSIIGTLYYLTDGFIVSFILNEEEYAILRNGAFQIPFISTIYSIIGIALMSDISNYIQNQEKSKIVLLKSRAISLAIVVIYPITIFLIVFAKHWIPYLFTSVYQGSVLIFMVYNIMTLFRVTSYESIIVLSENAALLPAIYTKSFLINVLLSVPLTYYLGPLGSAIATILSFFYLIKFLTKLNLEYLNVPISDLVNLKHLTQITAICILLSLCPYGLNFIINMNQISQWLLPITVSIMLALTYHLLFKSNYIIEKDKESFFKMIPIGIIKQFCFKQYCNNLK